METFNNYPEDTLEEKGAIIWLTGLSGAGKTSIAKYVCKILGDFGYKHELIDGDVFRQELNCDLGFDDEGRRKNIKTAAYLAGKLSKHGIIVVAALISPFKIQRDQMKESLENFIEVYVNAPLDICIKRDEKGLYKEALDGKISNFTGISHKYEPPTSPDLELQTDKESVEESSKKILVFLKENYLPALELKSPA